MTITHHEPVPIHHIEDLTPEEQADLHGVTKALIAITVRIKTLMGGDKPKMDGDKPEGTFVLKLGTPGPTVDIDERERSSQNLQQGQLIEESAEFVRNMIAQTGEQGMSLDEFQAAAAGAGIDLKNEAIMQALIFGFDENKFSIRDRDNRIVANLVSSELQNS